MGLKETADNLSALQRKSPPQNLEAEQALLSAILIDNRTLPEVLEILQLQDFYRDSHVEIFNAMVTLFNRREPIDLVTVHNVLKDSGKLASCGGAAYISKLVDAVPAAINPKMYARIVHEKSVVRGLIYKSNDIINQCFQAYEDVDALIDFADSALFEIYNRRIGSVFTSVGNLIPGNVAKIESWYKDKSLVRGLPTGFKDFDRLTHGLQDSDLIILAARPSMGKTTLALNMARNVAVDFGAPVAVFSLEISEISRSLKSLAKELKVPVIALSQLNRELEKRKNKQPQLSDLRESGSLEQDTDLVVFIYREEVYEEIPDAAARGRAEIILAKHRNGPTDSVRLAFLKQYTRFENLAPQQ